MRKKYKQRGGRGNVGRMEALVTETEDAKAKSGAKRIDSRAYRQEEHKRSRHRAHRAKKARTWNGSEKVLNATRF